MTANECARCGAALRPGGRFCPQCGRALDSPAERFQIGPRYSGLWFQVDPMNPPPRRDVRWTLIVVGIALTVLGLMLLAVGSIVAGASVGCGSAECAVAGVAAGFGWAALGFLAVGIGLAAVGLWLTLR